MCYQNKIDLFKKIIDQEKYVALDTETTGLDPYSGDSAFAVSLAVPGVEYYFEVDTDLVSCLSYFFNHYTGTIFMHNAKFDIGFFLAMGCQLFECKIHCTMSTGRLLNSSALSLSLDNLGKELGYAKDDGVMRYLNSNKLFDWELRPGKKKRSKKYYFNKIPRDIMEPYAKKDAKITLELGLHQVEKLKDKLPLLNNETLLTTALAKMQDTGIKINREFVSEAWKHEQNKAEKAKEQFQLLTNGKEFVDHYKTLFEALKDSEDISYTDKGNPTFRGNIISSMKSPIARVIEDYRAAHTRSNYYESILHFADEYDTLHANSWQSGCATGRMSYSDPPLQCMEKVEKDHPDYASHYLIRRSFIPRPEYFFVMMDYDQFEYRMMVNYARETSLIEKIQSGIDVHTATAELMGVSRKEAKTINFMLLYGGGVQKLAEALNVPLTRAKFLKEKYFATLPKVQILISQIQNAVCSRGYLENWFGRRYTLPRELAYKGPNYLIQGGCADWVKIAICNIHRFLKPYKSRILLQIHDELLFEIHEEEKFIIPKLKYLMENVSHIPPHDKLRYTVGIEYSYASWQDKKVWDEAGNNLQTKSGQEIKNDSP